MEIFDIKKYNEMKLYSTTLYGETYTTIKISGQLSDYKYMDLTMISNVLNDSSKHFGFTIDISCIHSKK